ncbi:DUF1045 domain-containing protein [Bradyrhizobium brasilense]|uniref:DUF1045 domain-containing protein n=1 Tax=Bradyrhizobium brasilense TaxID=1419277 RepID=UPI003CC62BA4
MERALRTLVGAWLPCPIGPLKIDLVGGFFALVPANPIPTLLGFASHIVEEFDRFRASLSQDEFQRCLRSPSTRLRPPISCDGAILTSSIATASTYP